MRFICCRIQVLGAGLRSPRVAARSPRGPPTEGPLFYRNGAQMMVVDLDTQSALRVGTPEVLFINDEYRLNTSAAPANPFYDVLPGGERFVMVQSGAAATEVSVVQNFFEELRQVVPE